MVSVMWKSKPLPER